MTERSAEDRSADGQPAGRIYDACLHVLDRQIVDSGGEMIAKVDDLDLEIGDEGTPYVTALLIGPAALGPRIGGQLGKAMVAIQGRLHRAGGPGPGRIPIHLVSDIGSAVTVSADPADLPIRGLEDWVRTRIIDAIPGASDAPQ
jgi:sporulation protein YlmC with PRC-barrel domain